MKQVSTVLTIAGTDPSGGAGIQADLKTFQELQTYGMSVITSVVAQNTTGVQSVHHLPVDFIEEQLDSVLTDIPVDAFKTGMIATEEMMRIIYHRLKSQEIYYVLDPVMVATSGDVLIDENAREYLRDYLIPLSTVITPNIPEAEYLTETSITSMDDMKVAAKIFVHELGASAALIKGGHLEGEPTDWLYNGEEFYKFTSNRINTTSTHGTGCTYSAAITALLAQGKLLLTSIESAKQFVTAALKYSFPLGHGNGPTNHWGIREGSYDLERH
ncbi:bifunctional hydroxymethylpyrimidine kinase/phosphomethylpyrimidine kinase [Piscibacillus sp. B03]|uniref:bifunctional hydroxymethylpyrimidine kinase/phosphomethylpyrimidine kinase n=1 Tax=Piscibacillus sp. B03 TaxID=3457430 RepID=UPI003FCCA764